MQYSFSMTPNEINVPLKQQQSKIWAPMSEYFGNSATTQTCQIKQNHNSQNHMQILLRDLKNIMRKHLKEARQRFQRQFDSYFEQLNNKVERYILSTDLCCVVQAKYLNSDPVNLVPMIKYQFGNLIPEVTQSLSGFCQNIRKNVTLDTNGKGTFKFEKKMFENIYQSRPSLTQKQQIRNRSQRFGSMNSSPYGSASKINKNNFGQIQTSHFETIKTHNRPFDDILRQQQRRKSISRQPLRQYTIQKYQNVGPTYNNNEVQQVLLKMNVDRQTRQKIGNVIKHQNELIKGNLKQNIGGSFISNPSKQYLIQQPNKYIYQFTRNTYQ